MRVDEPSICVNFGSICVILDSFCYYFLVFFVYPL
jgi:hypothetical protein